MLGGNGAPSRCVQWRVGDARWAGGGGTHVLHSAHTLSSPLTITHYHSLHTTRTEPFNSSIHCARRASRRHCSSTLLLLLLPLLLRLLRLLHLRRRHRHHRRRPPRHRRLPLHPLRRRPSSSSSSSPSSPSSSPPSPLSPAPSPSPPAHLSPASLAHLSLGTPSPQSSPALVLYVASPAVPPSSLLSLLPPSSPPPPAPPPPSPSSAAARGSTYLSQYECYAGPVSCSA